MDAYTVSSSTSLGELREANDNGAIFQGLARDLSSVHPAGHYPSIFVKESLWHAMFMYPSGHLPAVFFVFIFAFQMFLSFSKHNKSTNDK
ncbi:hypothetical protein [Paenibacillus senegalimassiliensis]|uniref:hypothetical protein n=1 Tax=Paenibacillus senegalimassiliensis TaxID=1737426 RepID=UPI00073E1AE2|nr:hypothetical protein [Paenibacillus senegalimassiliensis]